MKAFAFQLESALLLREREEQAGREAYARALQALAIAQDRLTDARTLLEELNAAFAERRKRGFKAEEQITYWRAAQQRAVEFERRKELHAQAAAEAGARRAAMIEARKRYETLLRLKSKRRQAHEAAFLRGEEKMIDDMVVARFARNRMEAMR